jgi:carboxyl-terminal processing protease
MKFTRKIVPSLTALALAVALASVGFGAELARTPADARTTDANITRLTTNLLEHSQLAHHPFDGQLAGNVVDRYLDALDGARSLFLQSDVGEFAAYRATLAQVTRGTGDTSAAKAIFARYLERLSQQTAYDTNALQIAKFDFTGHDSYSFDREHARRPATATEAQALWWQQLRAEYLQEKLTDKRPDQIVSTLANRHAQELRTMTALRSDEVLEIYLDTLAHVYDPHSDYLGHEQMESLSIAMNLSLFGIGASLESEDGYCKIRELLPGGPAARSGLLKPGDRIVAVAQAGKEPVDIVNMPLSHTVELIRGPKGSTVTLTVIPAGGATGAATKTASLVRDEITLEDQQAKARIVDLPTGKGTTLRLGVIDLPSFYADMSGGRRRSATADVSRLLGKLNAEHVRGIVLDLRHNGGGSLEEAINLTGLFIRKGPIVQTRGADGKIQVDEDTDPSVLYDGPLVLMTSRFSASASEILAGALQDYGRAVVVGDSSTFGKGTVQNILPLAPYMDQVGLGHAYDPGALKITTSKFYRPSGASTQLRGVPADVVLPSTSDFSDVSEASLKDPLPWDVVPAAPYEQLNRVKPYVAALRDESSRRRATEKPFTYLADDIARLKKNLVTKSVSLNEAERRQEMAQSKVRETELASDERALRATRPTTYEITLKNASSPGLPLPLAFTNSVVKKGAEDPTPDVDDLGSDTKGRPNTEDIILDESVQILADYVTLLRAPEALAMCRRPASDVRNRPPRSWEGYLSESDLAANGRLGANAADAVVVACFHAPSRHSGTSPRVKRPFSGVGLIQAGVSFGLFVNLAAGNQSREHGGLALVRGHGLLREINQDPFGTDGNRRGGTVQRHDA